MNLSNIRQSIVWLIIIGLSGLFLSSCNIEVKPKKSTGKTNEILVVTNTKTQWENEIGHVIRAFFEQPLEGLPQAEPKFRLFNVAEKDFNKIFKAQHNILIVDVNPKYTEAQVETRTDYWTRPQRVIKITAPDTTSFRVSFEAHKTAFLKVFNDLEIQRTNEQFAMARSVSLMNILKKKFGFTLQIPGGFVVGAESEHFMWLRQSMHKVKQDVELGIMIYEEPYTDTSAFAPEYILSARDSLSSMFVPGPSEGSYMILSRGFIEPVFTRIDDFPTGFAVETRGLWMVQNDFMGGPFISFTFVDPKLERVITLDGYVYNPSDLKGNFIRQMESIFYSISFTKEIK